MRVDIVDSFCLVVTEERTREGSPWTRTEEDASRGHVTNAHGTTETDSGETGPGG